MHAAANGPRAAGVLTASLLVGSYLLGAIPFAWVLGRLRGVDIRKIGSGNIGATNLSRACGRGWGIAAFACDFAKGFIPVTAVMAIQSRWPEALAPRDPALVLVLTGLSAILGHVFPVYLRFRGGKAVATTFGVMTSLSWAPTALAGAVWLAVYASARTVSLASMVAVIVLPLALAVIERGRPGFGWILGFAAAMSVLVLVRHRSNIARLLRGEELKFGVKEPGAPHERG
jgi:glycerol-3-phosphate acyltransferase PlsY